MRSALTDTPSTLAEVPRPWLQSELERGAAEQGQRLERAAGRLQRAKKAAR